MQYKEVPNIITGKDLDYLSDMFNWNYGALKTTNSSIEEVQNEEIKSILEEGFNMFDSNINEVLEILKGGNYE
ncbi:MAG: spore coat protein [Lactobacillales bacterium]|nr:spore coat protein [Lactobacillales bacterium]